MATDPFRRTGQKGRAPQLANDPRYALDTSDSPTDRANAAAREQDFASDVTTDPAREGGDLKEASDEQPFKPASSRKLGNDPIFRDDETAIHQTPNADNTGNDPLGSSLGQTPFADYEKLRTRLDAAGATNWKFDRDDIAGETTFSCEVPYRKDPTTFRVFEAKSKDDLKAMLAVAEQVERWSAAQNSSDSPPFSISRHLRDDLVSFSRRLFRSHRTTFSNGGDGWKMPCRHQRGKVRTEGLEPSTNGLKVRCSTD